MKLPVLHAGALRPVLNRILALAEPWAGVKPFTIEIKSHKSKRSLEQNARFHAMLGDVSKQIKWPVNGKERLLSIDEWKCIFTAALVSEKRLAMGLNGDFVLLGERTRDMSIKKMTALIELIFAFGAERGVIWSEKFPDEFGQYFNEIQ